MYLRTTDTYRSLECKNRKESQIFFNILFWAELKGEGGESFNSFWEKLLI